jgi:hypothetical protein
MIQLTSLMMLLVAFAYVTAGCAAVDVRGVPGDPPNESALLKHPGLVLYVSYFQGEADPHWSGRLPRPNAARTDGPLPDIEAARDLIRALKQSQGLPKGGVLVVVRGNDVTRSASLLFTEADSGSPESPIVYSAPGLAPGPSPGMRFIGGQPVRGWKPVTEQGILDRLNAAARERVVVCDLKAQGITDYGGLSRRGHGPRDDTQLPLELFHNDQPLDNARWPNVSPWPNEGLAVNTSSKGATLTADNAPFATWKGANPDARVFGYWGTEWSYYTQPIAAIQPDRIDLAGNANFGDRFFVANVLEALDAPGEYYLDRERGLIYFYPPDDSADASTFVSMLAAPLLHLKGASHIGFERMGFEMTRGQAVRIDGGEHVTLAGCVIRNVGTEGIYLDHCRDVTILSCDITHTGDTGVFCNVGDRVNLVPANITIRNNHFHNIARIAQVYCGAVGGSYGGYMGVTIANNLIHEMNHTAIFFWGNDIRIERNEVYNVVLQSDDAGAFYTGRDLTFQGNAIVGNYLHHTGSSGRHDVYGTMGIYHDDGAGGSHIEGNIFHHVSKAVFAGGGINTLAQNNIFVDCHPAYWIDERLRTEAPTPNTMLGGFMRERFDVVVADSKIWTARYPSMALVAEHYRENRGIPPYNNVFRRNVIWRSPDKWMISPWVAMPDRSLLDIGDNLIAADPHFTDEAWGDFTLRADSPARTLGIEPIDMKSIGLQHDAYRTAIPRVASRIELVRPFTVTDKGAAGRVRVSLRNTGDGRVTGEELLGARGVVRVEAAGFMDGLPGGDTRAVGGLHIGAGRRSLTAAPPKIATIEHDGRWAFDIQPGETIHREFDVTLAPGSTKGYDLLQLDTRGRIALPSRLRVPFVYPLTAALELLRPLSADLGSGDGAVRLTVRNTDNTPGSDTLRLQTTPEVWASLAGATSNWSGQLAPGASDSVEYSLKLAHDTPMGAPLVQVVADGIASAKATLRVPIERTIPVLPAGADVGQLAAQLADERAYPLFANWSRQSEPGQSPFAWIRFAIVGENLGVVATVQDAKVLTTEALWNGSCIEVFGAAGHGQTTGQVFLIPATQDRPATGHYQHMDAARAAPDIRVISRAVDGGYEMAALIPLKLLAVTDANSFVLEAAVTTSDVQGNPGARRGTIFGSPKAYADNTQFGTMRRR